MRWRWIINSHQTAPPDGYATSVEWRHLRFDLINITNSNHNTDWQKTITVLSGFLQGYQDIVNEKVASAIAKLEEAGLTPEACEKFLKTYGKVILNCCSMLISTFFLLFWVPLFFNVNILPSVQVLHPNHAHMLDIKYSYLNILGHSEGWEWTGGCFPGTYFLVAGALCLR